MFYDCFHCSIELLLHVSPKHRNVLLSLGKTTIFLVCCLYNACLCLQHILYSNGPCLLFILQTHVSVCVLVYICFRIFFCWLYYVYVLICLVLYELVYAFVCIFYEFLCLCVFIYSSVFVYFCVGCFIFASALFCLVRLANFHVFVCVCLFRKLVCLPIYISL